MELGPKDIEKQSVVCVRRDTSKKEFISWATLAQRIPEVLDEMHDAMLESARKKVAAARVTVRPCTVACRAIITAHTRPS